MLLSTHLLRFLFGLDAILRCLVLIPMRVKLIVLSQIIWPSLSFPRCCRHLFFQFRKLSLLRLALLIWQNSKCICTFRVLVQRLVKTIFILAVFRIIALFLMLIVVFLIFTGLSLCFSIFIRRDPFIFLVMPSFNLISLHQIMSFGEFLLGTAD